MPPKRCDAKDIAVMEKIAWDGDETGWIHFSLANATWVPFTVKADMQSAFKSLEALEKCVLDEAVPRAESCVNNW